MHCCQGVLLLPWKLQAGGISAKMMVVSAVSPHWDTVHQCGSPGFNMGQGNCSVCLLLCWCAGQSPCNHK